MSTIRFCAECGLDMPFTGEYCERDARNLWNTHLNRFPGYFTHLPGQQARITARTSPQLDVPKLAPR